MVADILTKPLETSVSKALLEMGTTKHLNAHRELASVEGWNTAFP